MANDWDSEGELIFAAPTREIDWDKVNTFEDLKTILKATKLVFSAGFTNFDAIWNYTKKYDPDL